MRVVTDRGRTLPKRGDMSDPMDKPPVRINNAGVISVSAYDVLRSRAGQEQIRKTLHSKIYTGNARPTKTGEAAKK